MKKSFLLILLAFVFENGVEAQGYFNKRFDHNGGWIEWAQSLYLDSTNIYSGIVVMWNDGIGNLATGSLLKMDSNGNAIKLQTNKFSATNTYVNSIAKIDSGFVMVGMCADTSNTDIMVYKLNNNCDSIWTKRFGGTPYQDGWMIKKIGDDSYVISGGKRNGTYPDMLLMKIDTSGNILWENLFGLPTGGELGLSFTETKDNGFAVSGFRSIPNDFEIYIVKTDSSGTMQWDTAFGSPWYDEAPCVISTMDSNIVVAAFIASDFSGNGNGHVIKFDLNGNMLWDKQFGDSEFPIRIYTIKELSDGSLIAAGNCNTHRGYILKLSPDGDSLWHYDYFSSENGLNFLNDIFPSPDGGFVACGHMVPHLPDTGNQDCWFLKIDSLGCEVANCTVSIPKPEKNKEPVNVFPNPFSSNINIELNESKTDFDICILDVFGKSVKNYSFSNRKSIQIELNDLSEGLYFLVVKEKNKTLYSGKIVRVAD